MLYFGAVNNLVHSGVLRNQQHDESSLRESVLTHFPGVSSDGEGCAVRTCLKKRQSEIPNHFF